MYTVRACSTAHVYRLEVTKLLLLLKAWCPRISGARPGRLATAEAFMSEFCQVLVQGPMDPHKKDGEALPDWFHAGGLVRTGSGTVTCRCPHQSNWLSVARGDGRGFGSPQCPLLWLPAGCKLPPSMYVLAGPAWGTASANDMGLELHVLRMVMCYRTWLLSSGAYG